jgi:hypothetical protein
LAAAFALFDLSGDGRLEHFELKACLDVTLSDYIDPTEVTSMIEEADTDGSGTVDIMEFMTIMNKHKESGAHGWGKLNLFNSVGGDASIREVVTNAYNKVQCSEIMRPYFEGKDIAKITEAQCVYFAAAVGGPSPWTGRTLEEMHTGLNIT